MPPLSYLGRTQSDVLDEGLVPALAEHFQLTNVLPPYRIAVDQPAKWVAVPWSRSDPFPALPGDLLVTSGFLSKLPFERTWAYPTLDHPLNISQGELEALARCKRVVCPTTALAELLADGLGYLPGVVRPGVPAGRPLDTQRTEYGREELRQALWHGIQDDHLLVLADWLAGADELVAALGRLDRQDVRLVFRESGPVYQAALDQLINLNDLEQGPQLTPHKAWASDQLLFNAADLYIPARSWCSDIELAMACGCIPAVPDIDFWAERVDQQRGVELPTYIYVEDEGAVTFRYDPVGVAQLIDGLTIKELRQRRINCLAWAADPVNSWKRKAAQWQQILGH